MSDGEEGGPRTIINVYIPAPGSELEEVVWPESGMVGSEVDDTGRIRVDYEGDQKIFHTYEARVARAAERHLHARSDGGRGYMTRACAYVDSAEVIEVGRWDPAGEHLTIKDRPAVAEWLGNGDLPGSQAQSSGRA